MQARMGTLAVAALTCLALFCVMASTATAKEQRAFYLTGEKSEEASKKPTFAGEIYPTYLNGGTSLAFGFQLGTLECPGEFSGLLGSATPELTITSFYEYWACSTPGGRALTITANGCENTLTVLNQGPPYVGHWGYKCPPGVYYEFHEGSGSLKCSFAIPSQSGLAEVGLENTGEGKKRSVAATLNVSKLKYTIKGPPLFCKAGEYENGTITGTMTLKGFDE